MFYNTTNETGDKLKEYREKASQQDREVLDLFINNSGKAWNSHEVEKRLGKYSRSSIVRSINTLENEGLIEKTANKVIGNFGRLVHTYRLSGENGQNNLF